VSDDQSVSLSELIAKLQVRVFELEATVAELKVWRDDLIKGLEKLRSEFVPEGRRDNALP